jgi:hypothetical protein
VPHLLELALADRQRGRHCGKRGTRAIYEDADALAEALLLARRGRAA